MVTREVLYSITTALCNKGVFFPLYCSNWEKDPVERQHNYIQFFKYFLGLNRKVPNVVARNETGRLSLKLNILLRIIKFWILLESLPENNIAKQCLIISNRLANELLLRCFSEDFVSVDPAENVGTIIYALGPKQPLKNLVSINDILSYQSYQNGESVFFFTFQKNWFDWAMGNETF